MRNQEGYCVALAVFGRDETFDPSADPVVRLEAGRLRRSLSTYYVDAGARDAVRITIPKGGYVAYFAWQERNVAALPVDGAGTVAAPLQSGEAISPPPPDNALGSRRRIPGWKIWSAVLLFAALLSVAGLSWVWLRGDVPDVADTGGPAIIVLPFEALGDADGVLAAGLAQELITDLMRFSEFRLYSAPASFRQNADANPEDLGRELGVSYVITGSVRSDTADVRIGARLVDARSGRIIWSETYDRSLTPDALLDVQAELADGIASTLGQSYGVVQRDVADRLASGAVPHMPSYECVLRAYAYRRSFDTALRRPVFICLEDAIRRDPEYATAWALLAWLQLDTLRFETPPGQDFSTALRPALEAAQRAVAIDPRSVVSLQALAAINHYLGRYGESERVQREALALNPHDSGTLAQLGWRLVVRGRFEEGTAYIQRAVDRSVNPPGWYFHYIAIDRLMRGDYAGMLASAQRSAIDGSGMSQSFIAIAQGALGNMAAANEALQRMAEISPELARNPAAAYRVHGPVDSIVNALVDGLHKAGLQELPNPATP